MRIICSLLLCIGVVIADESAEIELLKARLAKSDEIIEMLNKIKDDQQKTIQDLFAKPEIIPILKERCKTEPDVNYCRLYINPKAE